MRQGKFESNLFVQQRFYQDLRYTKKMIFEKLKQNLSEFDHEMEKFSQTLLKNGKKNVWSERSGRSGST